MDTGVEVEKGIIINYYIKNIYNIYIIYILIIFLSKKFLKSRCQVSGVITVITWCLKKNLIFI